MTKMLHILTDKTAKFDGKQSEFKNDVLQGLSKSHKELYSKYFYDSAGSNLFNQITRHQDYYLTNCELEILHTYKNKLSTILSNESFNLIELGPGEGIKTQLLIEQFIKDSLSFTYIPIDISKLYLEKIMTRFQNKLPSVNISAINSDYFKALEWLSVSSEKRNIVLFLGSSIGNFDFLTASDFLRHLWEILHPDDYILIGFDLRKDIDILMRAYNDSDGITREFNLNLLKRINKELHANFDITKFNHYGTYNASLGAMESYLISNIAQEVYIGGLKHMFSFLPFEPIHVEYSFKYRLSQVEELARVTEFKILNHFFDSKNYFVDSLWQVKK